MEVEIKRKIEQEIKELLKQHCSEYEFKEKGNALRVSKIEDISILNVGLKISGNCQIEVRCGEGLRKDLYYMDEVITEVDNNGNMIVKQPINVRKNSNV